METFCSLYTYTHKKAGEITDLLQISFATSFCVSNSVTIRSLSYFERGGPIWSWLIPPNMCVRGDKESERKRVQGMLWQKESINTFIVKVILL